MGRRHIDSEWWQARDSLWKLHCFASKREKLWPGLFDPTCCEHHFSSIRRWRTDSMFSHKFSFLEVKQSEKLSLTGRNNTAANRTVFISFIPSASGSLMKEGNFWVTSSSPFEAICSQSVCKLVRLQLKIGCFWFPLLRVESCSRTVHLWELLGRKHLNVYFGFPFGIIWRQNYKGILQITFCSSLLVFISGEYNLARHCYV